MEKRLILASLACIGFLALALPASAATPTTAIGDLLLPEPQPEATCTVTVQCQHVNIKCTSLNGDCQASPPNECVVCDGVTQSCCSCADCEWQCDYNYWQCQYNCYDLPPRFCDRCDVIYDRCLSFCPC
jgi:hypothetical protein